MGFVLPLLPVKIDIPSRSWRVAFPILAPETLLARPGLDQRPIHRKMFIRHERLGAFDHPPEKSLRDLLVQQPFPILTEHRMIPDLLIHLHPHKPPEQQVVLQLFDQHSFTTHRIEESATTENATTAPARSTDVPHWNTTWQTAATSLSESHPPACGWAAVDDPLELASLERCS